MKYFTKIAGAMQTEYKFKGNRVFRTITSTQPFEGAKQPNIDQKFFMRTDEVKDFAEKQALLKRFHTEKMTEFKKLSSKRKKKKFRYLNYGPYLAGSTAGGALQGVSAAYLINVHNKKYKDYTKTFEPLADPLNQLYLSKGTASKKLVDLSREYKEMNKFIRREGKNIGINVAATYSHRASYRPSK